MAELMRLVRRQRPARNTSDAEQWEYSSRKWMLYAQA